MIWAEQLDRTRPIRDRDIDVRRREMRERERERERDQRFFNVFLRKVVFVSANCKAKSHVMVPPVLAQNKYPLKRFHGQD